MLTDVDDPNTINRNLLVRSYPRMLCVFFISPVATATSLYFLFISLDVTKYCSIICRRSKIIMIYWFVC